jgi:hypothetical protein
MVELYLHSLMPLHGVFSHLGAITIYPSLLSQTFYMSYPCHPTEFH